MIAVISVIVFVGRIKHGRSAFQQQKSTILTRNAMQVCHQIAPSLLAQSNCINDAKIRLHAI
jgi:hypothetical protein